MKRFINYIRHHLDDIFRIFLFLLTIVFLIAVFPKEGKFKYEFQKGKPWLHDDLYAPFDFAINKTQAELDQEKSQVLASIKPYFNYDYKVGDTLEKSLKKEFDDKWLLLHDDSRKLNKQKEKNYKICLSIFDTIFNRGVIEFDPSIENKGPGYDIFLVKDNVATEVPLSRLFTVQQASEYIEKALSDHPDADQGLISGLLSNVVTQNVFFDKDKTSTEQQAALESISPSRGMVQKGELLISRGRIVSSDEYRILQSLKQNYETQLGSSSAFYAILAGQIILISISILVLGLFLMYFRKDILANNKKIFLILLIISMMVFAASLVVRIDPNYFFLVPICMVPLLIRAFFDTRLALFVHIITIVTAGFLVPNSFQFVFLQLIAGIVTIMSVVRLERRSQFFLTSVWVFLTYSAIYVGMTLIQEGTFKEIQIFQFTKFAINAAFLLFAYPLIYILEKLFGIITEVTLMELGNSNNKLLRELAQKAPGTFQHSLQVANLAEEALFAIGGQTLLARVGALYHDIGKMNMPLYFIENQVTGFNPHDELTFEESAQIIVDHVIQGIEMAKKNNLPEEIIDFIRTHHGTRKVEYFYIKQKQDSPENLDEKRFTYPGPIPFSKETAVVMMADSVEAASRSLAKPDEESINKLVDSILQKQLDSDQFINANITLKDISKVRKILKKKLQNIYHVRIAYPES